MKWIICSYLLPKRASWANLAYLGLPALIQCKIKLAWSGLTKLVISWTMLLMDLQKVAEDSTNKFIEWKTSPSQVDFLLLSQKKIKSCYWSLFINHLLTKLVQSRCPDVSLVLYLRFYKPQLHPSPLKCNKSTQADISYLDLSLVNNPDIPL